MEILALFSIDLNTTAANNPPIFKHARKKRHEHRLLPDAGEAARRRAHRFDNCHQPFHSVTFLLPKKSRKCKLASGKDKARKEKQICDMMGKVCLSKQ